MIYPAIGLSMAIHILIIALIKAGGFMAIKFPQKQAGKRKNYFPKKIFSALAIAFLIEAVVIVSVGSSTLAIMAGLKTGESNISLVKNLISYIKN